jgi:L-ascorbate metabolism protein UlaG (beta-lactamase superfamily)
MPVITVASGTLFNVALQHLGDATQWVRIASLNGISDPWLSGLVTLQLPPFDASAGGGVGAQ